MKSLRIILGMIEPPVPFGNAVARWTYVLLKELVARGHRVTAFAACSKESEMLEARRIFPAPEFDLRLYAIPTKGGLRSKFRTFVKPYSYMFSREFLVDFDKATAEGFDVLQLEQLFSGWLVGRHRKRALLGVHHLYRIDQEHLRPKSIKGWMERFALFSGERRVLRKFDFIRAGSPRLMPAIHEINPAANVVWAPLGIDPSLYCYIDDSRRGAGPVVGLTGNMQWYPTSSAAIRLLTRLWPEIQRRVPDARLQIVGWGARSALKEFLGRPGVSIEENVPDIQPYFERMSLLLYAPGRGSGMKIKIMEALAFGVPVVTTSEGIEGLPAIDGVHAAVAEDDAGLIERTVAILKDPELGNRLRRAGRHLLELQCGPKPTIDSLEALYETIVRN